MRLCRGPPITRCEIGIDSRLKAARLKDTLIDTDSIDDLFDCLSTIWMRIKGFSDVQSTLPVTSEVQTTGCTLGSLFAGNKELMETTTRSPQCRTPQPAEHRPFVRQPLHLNQARQMR